MAYEVFSVACPTVVLNDGQEGDSWVPCQESGSTSHAHRDRLGAIWQYVRLLLLRIMGKIGGRRFIEHLMWWTQAKFVMAIVLVVFWDDRLLLLEHSYRPRYPWGLPTGWVHYGESLEEAARRELMEECGLTVDALRWMDAQFPNRRHLECLFWAEAVESSSLDQSGPSGDGEIRSWDWFSWQEGLPEKLLPTQRPIIERAVLERKRFYQMQRDVTRDEVSQSCESEP